MADNFPPPLPESFPNEEALEEFMTAPTPVLAEDLARLEGDILILGVGGKMGPTLAGLAKRAAPGRRVVGVARFSNPDLRGKLEDWGVETIPCDLLDREKVAALPRLPNVVFMAGRKFGTSGAESLTWALNTHLPAIVAETFREARIVTFSTACVYPLVNVLHEGASETDPPNPPPGEYANSCVGRERIFEHFSRKYGTPGRLLRLSYAIDMRYGVLHDVARKVLGREVINLSMGHANVIWQGDANAQALRALLHCQVPTAPLNVSGPEVTSIRAVARAFGHQFGREPRLEGSEGAEAWLINTNEAIRLFGHPRVPLGQMIEWVADWVRRDMPSLHLDTHYDVRDGSY